jgi:hypothetical protein
MRSRSKAGILEEAATLARRSTEISIFLSVYCVQEWKKKYVTMCEDGRMTYHPSLHDYISNSVLCAGMEEEICDNV